MSAFDLKLTFVFQSNPVLPSLTELLHCYTDAVVTGCSLNDTYQNKAATYPRYRDHVTWLLREAYLLLPWNEDIQFSMKTYVPYTSSRTSHVRKLLDIIQQVRWCLRCLRVSY